MRGITIIRHLIPGWWLPLAERWVHCRYTRRNPRREMMAIDEGVMEPATTGRQGGMDCALLAMKLLADAATTYPDPEFQRVCLDTIGFLCNQLTTRRIEVNR